MTTETRVRPAAVAGTFYPANASTLAAQIDGYLDAAPAPSGPAPKALVVPHAGYMYSGSIAASGYATLRSARGTVTRVVLLGPAHFVPLRGLATSSAAAFSTPFGDVTIDDDARAVALALPAVSVNDAAHAREHSLEVHLPFVQRVLGDVAIVPFVVGHSSPEAVATVLDRLWGGPETVVIVSSDLSHYLDHGTASTRDRHTADAIVAGEVDGLAPEDACGVFPVRGLLVAAANHGLHATLLDLRNSGDTAGPRDRVVGYGAFALEAA